MMTARAPQDGPRPSSSHLLLPQQQQNQQHGHLAPPPPRRAPFLPRFSSGLSYGSALEADDELSNTSAPGLSDDETGSGTDTSSTHSTTGSDGTMSRYSGEDTRPTSIKELRGWYMYAFAAETYVICAIGSFIPILLESLARENGTLLKNGKPCGPSNDKISSDAKQCVVHVLGMEINTASFAMYTFSISVLVQALLVVSISSAADHGQYRKKLLLSFAWIGSSSVMLYIFISKNLYVLGAVLAIISNVAFGASFVLLNSFLPLLVRHHPSVLFAEGLLTPDLSTANGNSQRLQDSPAAAEDSESLLDNSSTTALLQDEPDIALSKVLTHQDQTSLELKLSTEISAKGIGIGYAAGLFVQCIAIVVLVQMKSTTWSLRVVLLMIGAWWAVFTVPAAYWLRPRPGPPLPAGENNTGIRALVSYTAYAWKSLYKTVKLARRLVDIVLFLGAWFLLSDAIATTSSTAILFAKTSLSMESWALGLISVISTTTGIAGALSWSWISRHFNLKPHQTLLACIALFELIPIYGLLGYLPFVRSWGVVGLQQSWEMFPLAAVYGFVLGGLSSYCRAVYGELIPPGSEAAFYALYAITDKGSSVFGPFIVASIIEATGEIRPAFWFLAVLVGLPAPLIYFVDVERGKLEAEKLVGVIEDMRAQREVDGVARENGEDQAMLGGGEEEAHEDDVERHG